MELLAILFALLPFCLLGFFWPGCPCCVTYDFYVVDGHVGGQNKLYGLTEAGVMTAIGSLGIPATGGEPGGLAGLDYDEDDNLVGITFGISTNVPSVWDVDAATGAASNQRIISGLTPVGAAVAGIARHPTTGVWYITYHTKLWTVAIDASSAAATLVGTMSPSFTEGDIAFDPTDDKLYACHAVGGGYLGTINVTTAAVTQVSTTFPTDTSALAFDPTGQLWGVRGHPIAPFTGDFLMKIDKTDGSVDVSTTITGDSLGSTGGMVVVR